MCSIFRHTTTLIAVASIWAAAAPRSEAVVGINPQIVVSTATPQIGELVEFTVIGVPEVEDAMWSFGGSACDGSSPVQTCESAPTDACTFQTYSYDSAGIKPVELTVSVDGVDYAAPQATIVVQNVGECEILECTILTEPAGVEIENTACGGETDETTPVIAWQAVDDSVGYRWQIIDSDGAVVDSGLTAGPVVVTAVGPLEAGTYVAVVQARGDGEAYCDSEWSESCEFTVVGAPKPASFTWWPEQPRAGERVRFVDLFVDRVLSWFWDFDDGSTSEQQHPTHVFDGPGEYTVIRDVELETGHVVEEKTITVAGAVECGNSVCESGETAWSCPADCALKPEETGRAGGSDRRPSVPAAAGGLHGSLDALWNTEAWVYNSGSTEATVVAEFTPTGQGAAAQAGPFTVEPDQSLYWGQALRSLFGLTGQGALRIDSTSPILFFTRISTSKPGLKRMPPVGSVGQEQTGISERLTLGQRDGALYLLGLEEGPHHSSLLHAYEIDGSPATARIDVFDNRGRLIRQTRVAIPGGAVKSLRLARLGLRRGPAYATVRVADGNGRLAVSGTVLDLITGDRISVPALHWDEAQTPKSGEVHQLVAVAFHRKGQFAAVWRSALAIVNPTGISQTVRLVYESEYSRGGRFGGVLETVLTLRPGQQLVRSDLISELFGLRKNVQTQGSLHLFHSGDLLVDSRVLNLQRTGGAVGSGLPALGAGDMIGVGETGVMIGLAPTPSTRTSLGLSEFSGLDTDVEIALSSTGPGPTLLGVHELSVPASGHLEINNLFERFCLDESPLQPIVVEVTTLRGGSVYPYVMAVDKQSGDPSIRLAARRSSPLEGATVPDTARREH